MADHVFDLAVIGSGPGGYVAAIRAAQLGFKVGCIEREANLGGVCLNIGCIPSKALLDSTELLDLIRHAAVHGIRVQGVEPDLSAMMARKEKVVEASNKGVALLFRQNGITTVSGTARFAGPTELAVTAADGSVSSVEAARIIIATGSQPIPFPGAPFDEERIVSNTGGLRFESVPRRLVVVGGGVIGLELGSIWRRLGSEVTVLELMPAILPGMDADLVKAADRAFRKQGFEIRTGVRVTAIERHGDEVHVSIEGGDALVADRVLCALGRRPDAARLGVEAVGIRVAQRGAIEVDGRYHTGIGEIYAVGDAIGGPLLAHKAEEEGVAAAENAAGLRGHVNYSAVPAVVYTAPEIASVGQTEAQARESFSDVRVGRFPFLANGRARSMAETDGFVKVLADGATGRLLGVHIIGPRASDLIAEAALAMEFGAAAEDIAISVHAHPTLPEALKEAALGAIGRAIHI